MGPIGRVWGLLVVDSRAFAGASLLVVSGRLLQVTGFKGFGRAYAWGLCLIGFEVCGERIKLHIQWGLLTTQAATLRERCASGIGSLP